MSILDDANTRIDEAVDLTQKHLADAQAAGVTREQAICGLIGAMTAFSAKHGDGDAATRC